MLVKLSLTWLLLTAIFAGIVNCLPVTPQQAVIKLEPQQKFQIITGWEATAQSGEVASPVFEKYREKLFEGAVRDLGINRIRLEAKSGLENPKDFFTPLEADPTNEKDWHEHLYEVINDNDDPFSINPNGFQFSEIDSTIEKVILPIRKLLAEQGEKLFVNLNYVDFKGNSRGNSNMRHNSNPEEYAEFILAVYQHIQSKYGFVPDAVEIILEPDTDTGWTATEIGMVMVATAKRLKSHNFKPAFIAPSTTSAANAPIFIDEIAKVPGAMEFVTEFSYHRYRGVSDAVLQQIADRAEKYGKQTSMLEWIGADYKTLHSDLKTARNSAWQQYTLAFPKVPDNGAQYYLIEDEDSGNPKPVLASRAKFLRQYFYYIRAGAQRIGAETTNANLDPLAFINSNGNYVLVVKANTPGTVTVQGLPIGTYGISYTTSDQAAATVPDVTLKDGESLSASIPSTGVLTIFAKGSDATKKSE